MSRRRYRQIVLEALPDTAPGIHQKTGLSRPTVFRWLASLHEAQEAHIIGWRRVEGGGRFVAVYGPGSGPDARCRLEPYTGAQKSRRYRAKARKIGTWEDRNAKVRRVYWRDREKARDPLTAALFGDQ